MKKIIGISMIVMLFIFSCSPVKDNVDSGYIIKGDSIIVTKVGCDSIIGRIAYFTNITENATMIRIKIEYNN